jgi:hypothetical protein
MKTLKASLIVIAIFVGLSIASVEYFIPDSSSSSNSTCDDRTCSRCGTYIGCNGYKCKQGLDIGPSVMYIECISCARQYCY